MKASAVAVVVAGLAISSAGMLSAVPAAASSAGTVPTCFGRPATIIGNGGRNFLVGTPGSDVIVGLGGRDNINGKGGNDFICGGAAGDAIDGGPGNDKIDGGTGDNIIEFYSATGGVTVHLATGTSSGPGAGHDTFTHFEDVNGSGYADHLVGDNKHNILDGLSGNDVIHGGKGNDTISVEVPSRSTANGGPGTDLFVPEPRSGDNVKGADGVIADLNHHYLRDRFGPTAKTRPKTTLLNIENLNGTDGDDILRGDAGPNVINGEDANDRIYGEGGNDQLYGDELDIRDNRIADDHTNGGPGTDRCKARHEVSCERS